MLRRKTWSKHIKLRKICGKSDFIANNIDDIGASPVYLSYTNRALHF
jgi:hypothetical protein